MCRTEWWIAGTAVRLLILLLLVHVYDARQGLHPRPVDDSRLAGRLRYVRIELHCWGFPADAALQCRTIRSDAPVFLQDVERWLRELQYPICESAFGIPGHRLVLMFEDGRTEEMFFRGLDERTPRHCYGFSWDGRGVIGKDEPFSDCIPNLER